MKKKQIRKAVRALHRLGPDIKVVYHCGDNCYQVTRDDVHVMYAYVDSDGTVELADE